MKTVLITGASGFFGKSLVQALHTSQTNDRFVCLYNTHRPSLSDQRFTWIQSNLLDMSQVNTLFETTKPTHLVHLAWYVRPQKFWHASENVAWVHATCHMFEAFCKNGGKHFIGAGTLSEYDLMSNPLDETSPLNPQTLYAEAKVATYRLLKHLQATHTPEMILQWLRIGYFFGDNEPPEKFLSATKHKMRTHQPVHVISKDAVRDYGHVRYLSEAIIKLLEHDENLTLNLSGGTRHTLSTILTRMAESLNYDHPIHYDAYPLPAHEALILTPHLEKMHRLLNIYPEKTFWQDLELFLGAPK